jgi:transposase
MLRRGMSNVLSETKKQQVIALGQLGWSLRGIESATGVRRETASKYLGTAGIPIREPRRRRPPNPASRDEVITDRGRVSNPASQVITDSEQKPVGFPAQPGRSPSASACEPFRDFVELSLTRGRNAMAIWQDLVTDYGFKARYASVQRFVHKLRGRVIREACGIIETAPGIEGQVDYGEGPMVRHPDTGKYRRMRLFILTLGYSRKAVRLLVWKSSCKVWAELHEKAFRRLGGTPKSIVLDNLREGVLSPDVYDPEVNPLFRDVLAHYGAVALPCRVRDPDRKGKVESSIGHTQKTPLKGLRFESAEEAQAYLDRWDERWANTRIHGTTKRQVAAMFVEEKPALLSLPVEPFRYYEFGIRTVHPDGCVEVQRAYYKAPPGSMGQEVLVQWDGLCVRLLDKKTGQLLREYSKQQPGHYRSKPEDRSLKTPKTTLELLTRADRLGKHIGTLCHAIHRTDGEFGVRRILGTLSLVKKFGLPAVDDACGAALEIRAPTYRFVRRYLERKSALSLTLRQVDPLIRELTQYREIINQITKGDAHESG